MDSRIPLIIGHRGAPGYRPEHTSSSYELAIRLGVDAVEPDVVATGDGVLVIRHENEISGTTDVAVHPEFADRRTTKTIDGEELTGWFTEDFTWDELSTLRCTERIPELRPDSAAYDGTERMLRLSDLLALLDEAEAELGRAIIPVIEIKHATYFASIGKDLAPLLLATLAKAGWTSGKRIVVESFEQTVLTHLREAGLRAQYIYLMEHSGTAADIVADPAGGPTYAEQYSVVGMDALVGQVDGISLDKKTILVPNAQGRATGPSDVVARAHDRRLLVFTWTCRPENVFLTADSRTGLPAEFGDYEREWAILRAAGVDGVFVDHPDLGVEFFRS